MRKTNEEWSQLSYLDESSVSHNLKLHEIIEFRFLRRCVTHFHRKGEFPSDTRSFRFNSITYKNWIDFVENPEFHRLVDNYDENFHVEPECEEPESFAPKKVHSSETSITTNL